MTAIHWTKQVSADFSTSPDWTPQTTPGAADDAILDAPGAAAYTVTSSSSHTVSSIQTAATATLSITGGAFVATAGTGLGANAGTISVGNNTSLTLGGTINNSGKITVNGGGNWTDLIIGPGKATLSGGGKIILNDNGSRLYGVDSSATLTNVDSTISGAGLLGNGQMTLVNQAKGVINATGANALVLNTAGKTVVNAGLLEGTGAGGLTIQSTTVNSAGGGTLLATNGSRVSLQSATLIGGTLKTTGTGMINTVDFGSALDGRGAHAVTVIGKLNLLNNTALTVQGQINLSQTVGGVTTNGSLNLGASGNYTDVVVASATTFTGGAVNLSDNGANRIRGVLSGAIGHQSVSTLVNQSVISGTGNIGSNLGLANEGVISATSGGALVLATGNAAVAGSNVIANSGTLQSINPSKLVSVGGLLLSGVKVANSPAGLIQANGAHTHVDLQSATITGGTLKTLAGGVIDTVDGGSMLDGSTSAVSLQGLLAINNNTALTLKGAINISGASGQIAINGAGNYTDLVIAKGDATVSGGVINLSDNGSNRIRGTLSGAIRHQSVSVLTTSSTISGGGVIGSNLQLTNTGVIQATTGTALVLQTGNAAVAGSNVINNSGTLQSVNPSALGGLGGLVLSHVVVANSGAGQVVSNGLHTHVDLQSATIRGGTLKSPSSGVFQTIDAGSVFDGDAAQVNNQATVNILNNTRLSLQGTINNTGKLVLNASGNNTDLTVGDAVTLKGGGAVTLSDNGTNRIYGTVAGASLTNVDNKISGAGQLGAGGLTLINKAGGVITATGGNALILNVGAAPVINEGLLRATGKGGLLIQNTIVDGSGGGTIQASAGSSVALQSAIIVGGTLKTVNTGIIQTADGGSLLDGTTSTVNLQGTLVVNNNTALTLQGAINNTGGINLSGAGNNTDLVIDETNVTLTGGGGVSLSNNSTNRIYGATAESTLNNVDNTITGAGQLGAGHLTLINGKAGVIEAFGSTSLTLNTGAVAVANSGLIMASGSGGLLIQNTAVDGSTGGTIQANDGSSVSLQSATIIGGILDGPGTGVFQTVDRSSVFDGTGGAVTNKATVNVLNNTTLTLQGSIKNSRVITLNSVGNATDLVVDVTNVTLSGGGTVSLGDNSLNRLYGATAAATLTNVDNTIVGAGQLGAGQLRLVNKAGGTISAFGGNALVVDTGAKVITNAGLITADTGGVMVINSAVANTGTLRANGGTLTMNGAISGAGAVQVGAGTLRFTQANVAQNVTFTGADGVLDLDHSMSFTGSVTGFTVALGTALDLRDISFVSPSQATYSGNAAGGTLTVSDGTHTAHIHLIGDYRSSTFTASSDGHGGTTIVDPAASAATAAPQPLPAASATVTPLHPLGTAAQHHFIAAMASFGAGSGGAIHTAAVGLNQAHPMVLAAPRLHAA